MPKLIIIAKIKRNYSSFITHFLQTSDKQYNNYVQNGDSLF